MATKAGDPTAAFGPRQLAQGAGVVADRMAVTTSLPGGKLKAVSVIAREVRMRGQLQEHRDPTSQPERGGGVVPAARHRTAARTRSV